MIIQKNHGKVVPNESTPKEKFKMIAKTMVNLEEVLADELREMGAENIKVGARAVEFEGDMRLLYRANYCCRTALAILKPFAEFDANNDQELYDQVYKIRWEKILDVDGTFMIDSTTSGEVRCSPTIWKVPTRKYWPPCPRNVAKCSWPAGSMD